MIFFQGQRLDTWRGKTVARQWQENGKKMARKWQDRGRIAILEVNENEQII